MVTMLGIESTAHTFGVGVVKNGKVLANVKRTYTTKSGGIIPKDAAEFHRNNKNEIYFEALDQSRIKEPNIDAIAFSQGPGLAPCLLEGMRFAKELAERLGKPLVPVNHCIAHLEIGKTTGARDPVMLYCSGANTQIIAYEAGKYRIFGETLDLGVGNFIDTVARFMGLGFPGGPKIEELAKKGKHYVEIPYKVKGMDIALSGIQTNLRQKLEKIGIGESSVNGKKLNNAFVNDKMLGNQLVNNNNNSKKSRAERVNYTLEDLAYSMQETIFAMLVETAERALAHTGKKELLLGGGVACNSRLQEMAKIMCKERGCKLFVPPRDLLIDNGSMISFIGEILYKNGKYVKLKDLASVDIKPRQRTDQVEIKYK